MITFERATGTAAAAGCWTARIAGTLMALFFLAFVVGEGPPPLFRLTLEQNLHFLGLSALALGLIAAWKWEALGGLIAVAGYILLVFLDARLAGNWLFLLPAAIGLGHVLCWLRLRGASPGRFPTVLWIAAGIFVLLCANEMFGNPPLMTPALRPSTMVGSILAGGGCGNRRYVHDPI